MKYKHIYICKPGCTYEPKAGKTNLQIRELQAFYNAMQDAGIDNVPAGSQVTTELVTVQQLLSIGLELEGCAVIIFNSAKCFDNELEKLLGMLSVTENIDITLVSNDCRLNFNINNSKITDRLVSRMHGDGITMRIMTNASTELEAYRDIVVNWAGNEVIPIYFSPLFTLPAFMPGIYVTDKTVDCVFACMHFKDYSERRQSELTTLREHFGDKLVLTGDMSGMTANGEAIESIVTDTKDVWQWYCNAMTTPVLLEPNYDRFGVMPNRVAEAIACRCLPILYTENTSNFDSMAGIELPVCTTLQGFSHFIEAIYNYAHQYNTTAVQNKLDLLQNSLGMYKTMLVQQLRTYFA